MRPPICEVCDEAFDPDDGGLVTCLPDPNTAPLDDAADKPGLIRHPPEQGWFCARHVSAAREAATSKTLSEVVAEVTRADAAPVRDRRSPFQPSVDDSLSGLVEVEHSIGARSPEAIDRAVRDLVAAIGEAFGQSSLTNPGSTGGATSDPDDCRLGPSGEPASASYAPHIAGDLRVFAIRVRFGDSEGGVEQQHRVRRVLVQRADRSIAEVAIVPADPATTAADGVVMLERVVVRVAPSSDPWAAGFDRAVEAFVAGLREPTTDPLDPAPDLIGVDLGSGSICRGRLRPDTSYVAWTTRHRSAAVVRIFLENLPDCLAAVGAATPVPELEATTKRSWTPMDGAVEPNCPFTDNRRWVGAEGDVEIEVASTEAFWSEGDVSNTSASLSISVGGERVLRLSHSQRLDSGGKAASLWLWRPTSASAVALTRRLFDV